MNAKQLIACFAAVALAACDGGQQASSNRPTIKVRGSEQNRLHELSAFDLAVALKHAIYDAGYTCKQVTDGGFVGEYKNLDMWKAHCVYANGATRDWAVFAGPDGSAQVRDCKDVVDSDLPACVVKKRPNGSFTEIPVAKVTTNSN